MKERLLSCLSDDVPVGERIFYLATFLCGIFCLFFVSLASLFRIDYRILLLFASIGIVSTISFFLNFKYHKSEILSLVFLCYSNFFAFPMIMLLSEKALIEVPLYSLVGLVFAIVLLKGIPRIVYYTLQVTVDLVVAFYCFVLKNPNSVHVSAESGGELFRIAVAIIVSGLLCGFMIQYKNYLLEKELMIRETATKNAEAASAAKDTFLVNVSHEIRTPLNAIIGTTELLLDSEAPNHVRETAFNIMNSSKALLSITSDLLDFSCMNDEAIVPVCEKYDVSLLLNDIINLMSVRLLDSNVEFFVDIDPTLPTILVGDSGKIRQVIINILSNATKYTKQGYMRFSVDYEHLGDNEILMHIKVEDTGIGIRKENLEKIFEPFNRSGEITDRVIEGNGLGLALCKKLAKAMDGDIYAESVYAEGSTFYFNLKQKYETDSTDNCVGFVKKSDTSILVFSDSIKEVENIGSLLAEMKLDYLMVPSFEEFKDNLSKEKYSYYFVDATSYERIKNDLLMLDINWKKLVVISGCNYLYSGEPFEYVLTRPVSCLNVADLINQANSYAIRKKRFEGTISLSNATILVVDDNLLNLDVASGILQRYNPRVVSASSGKECLIALERNNFDIVFLDYMMPEMDGIDTLKAIRKLGGKYETLPVVALTANVVSGAREMFLKAGFDDYLSKPLEISKLEKVLVKFLPEELVKYKI